jgi:hypothetical protein
MIMPLTHLLQEAKKFEVEAYKRPADINLLRKTHVAFSGSPLKHPYDPKKVILVPDPYGGSLFYYEFRSGDISFADELPSIVDLEGKTIPMVRIWVKKRSPALLCSPFLVEEMTPPRRPAGEEPRD